MLEGIKIFVKKKKNTYLFYNVVFLISRTSHINELEPVKDNYKFNFLNKTYTLYRVSGNSEQKI